MLKRILAAVALCLLGAQASFALDTWWLKAWPCRQVVEVVTPDPSGAINTALVNVDTEGKCFREGRDIRVVDAATGAPAKYHVLSSAGGLVDIEFLVADPKVLRYHVYYGNPEAPQESHEWERKLGGLTLTTYQNTARQNAASWQHMGELLRQSTWKYGEGPRKQIFDVDNPYGPDDYFLGVYKGKLYCRDAGEYTFATNSDDSSFLLVDGRLICQFPGGHDPLNDFDEKDGRAGNIMLTKGIHSIEYYWVETTGAQMSKAGWRTPEPAGSALKPIKTIPEEAFVRELRTAVLSREARDAAVNVFFTFHKSDEHQFTTLETGWVTFAFDSRATSRFGEMAFWAWDFGDGGASRAPNPEHQYCKEGDYKVRLYGVDSLGYRALCERTVSVKATDPTRVEPMMEVRCDEAVLKPAQPVRLSAKLRCTGAEEWPCRLVVEVKTPKGQVLERKTSPILLNSRQWLKEDQELQAAIGACGITFRLEYQGTLLLERSVNVMPADSRTGSLKVVNGMLVNERGERVLLRLSEDVVTPPLLKFVDRLKTKKRVTICVIDDSLAPRVEAEENTYYALARKKLLERFEGSLITVRRLGQEILSHHDPLERLEDLPERAAAMQPDLVIVAGSMFDLDRNVPAADYERYLYALSDRLRGATDAEILLVTPPPYIINVGLSKEYARKTMQVALRRGLPVADAYSAFTRSRSDEAWRSYFRDPSDPDVYYLQPNHEGQELIADRVVEALLAQ